MDRDKGKELYYVFVADKSFLRIARPLLMKCDEYLHSENAFVRNLSP